jgi:hypothetical protein
MTALTDREFVIIERDQGQGLASDPRQTNPARFKKIFRIDLDDMDASGTLIKEEVVDLMNLYDPRDVAADGRINTVFTFPFNTIEDVLVLDNNRLLVIDDNNYPGSNGREFGVPDNNEFIVLHVAPLIDCDDEEGHGHGKHGHRRHHDKNECELARD